MDLFYNGTFEEKLKLLKKDVKEYAKSAGYDYGRKRLYLAYGNPDNVGNNILFVTPPLNKDSKPYQDRFSVELIKSAKEFGLDKFFITSVYPIPIEKVTKKHIKAYSYWIHQTIDLFEPRLIVVMGEESEPVFVSRKFILRDCYGQKISTFGDTDVILAYPMSYYLEHSEYEDPSYKKSLKIQEWTALKELYDKHTK